MCTAGSLPVQWVFHSVILQPMRKASLKNLSRLDSIYTQILHAADKLDITSLAMPLIGAGKKTAAIRLEFKKKSMLNSNEHEIYNARKLLKCQ